MLNYIMLINRRKSAKQNPRNARNVFYFNNNHFHMPTGKRDHSTSESVTIEEPNLELGT